MNPSSFPGLFQAFGIELEYMIVDAATLDVLPVADEVLKAVAGQYVSDVQDGHVAWSNELVLHVLELKTTEPATEWTGWTDRFQQSVSRINRLLEPMNGRLLPTGAHPWMNPLRETKLWPHEYSPVYEAFNRLFDCRGHGWSNLQSCHLNLPFADDREFGKLHAAIRCLLPILPALAASSPILDGRPSGYLDTRLREYRLNCACIPSMAGKIIPEPVYSMDEYRKSILERIYRDLAEEDPEGILRDEFVNARGAIARFLRQTIEIRLLDVQETPAADLAIAEGVVACLRKLLAGDERRMERIQQVPTQKLADLLEAVIRNAGDAIIDDAEYLAVWGWSGGDRCSTRDLWAHLLSGVELPGSVRHVLDTILQEGSLARRLLRRLDGDFTKENLFRVYGEVADCLAEGRLFRP